MNGIGALIKETAGNSLSPSAMRGHRDNTTVYEPERRPSLDPESAGTLVWEIPASELSEVSVCLEVPQWVVFCYSSQSRTRQYLFTENQTRKHCRGEGSSQDLKNKT